MYSSPYKSLREYYYDVVNHFLEECTLCGECIRNCPLYSHVLESPSEAVMEGLMNFLRNDQFSKEIYRIAFGCASCAACSRACPQGIDVMEAFAAARMKLVDGGTIPESANFVDVVPRMWQIVSALLVKPSEMRWMTRVPSRPERAENVVFAGCTLPALPHTLFALSDLLDKLGTEYVILAGGELCCGFPFYQAGKIDELEHRARDLVEAIEAFSPRRVILPCAGCYRQFRKLYPNFVGLNFDVQYYAEYLSENIRREDFKQYAESAIYFQDSCMSRSTECSRMTEILLHKIPGLKVIKGPSICCGGTPKLTFPELAEKLAPLFRATVENEARNAGISSVVPLCQLCGLTLFNLLVGKHSLLVKDVLGLINECIGGKQYENRWLWFWQCRSEEEIVEKARQNFESHGLKEEEVKMALPLLLSWRL